MATVQEKMEAVAYWVGGSILCVVMAFFGTPLWGTIQSINDGFQISGAQAMSNMHAVQPVPMVYYGFLVAFEIALISRTAFIVWSRTTYESAYYY